MIIIGIDDQGLNKLTQVPTVFSLLMAAVSINLCKKNSPKIGVNAVTILGAVIIRFLDFISVIFYKFDLR